MVGERGPARCWSRTAGTAQPRPAELGGRRPGAGGARVDDLGLQIHIHAIGDAAVRQALDAIEFVIQRNGIRDRRPVIAHAQLVDDADIGRFAELGVIPNMQPLWAQMDALMTVLTIPRLGAERADRQYRMASLMDTRRPAGPRLRLAGVFGAPLEESQSVSPGVPPRANPREGGLRRRSCPSIGVVRLHRRGRVSGVRRIRLGQNLPGPVRTWCGWTAIRARAAAGTSRRQRSRNLSTRASRPISRRADGHQAPTAGP